MTSYTGATNGRFRTCATAITRPQAKVTDRRRLTTTPVCLTAVSEGEAKCAEGPLHDPPLSVPVRKARQAGAAGMSSERHHLADGLELHEQWVVRRHART